MSAQRVQRRCRGGRRWRRWRSVTAPSVPAIYRKNNPSLGEATPRQVSPLKAANKSLSFSCQSEAFSGYCAFISTLTTAVIDEVMSPASGAVHVGRAWSETNVSGSSFLQPAARSSKPQETIIHNFLVIFVELLFKFLSRNIIFLIVANYYYMVIFDNLIRTVIAGFEDDRHLERAMVSICYIANRHLTH